jgi:hypothetical protein
VGGVTTEPGLTGAAPPEAALLDDLTADLRTKVGQAWREFGRALADALPLLPANASIDFTLDPTASGTDDAMYSVCVTATGAGFTGLAVGNAGLPHEYRLSRAAIGDLVALGWQPPGVVDGSGDSFGLRLHCRAPRAADTRLVRVDLITIIVAEYEPAVEFFTGVLVRPGRGLTIADQRRTPEAVGRRAATGRRDRHPARPRRRRAANRRHRQPGGWTRRVLPAGR